MDGQHGWMREDILDSHDGDAGPGDDEDEVDHEPPSFAVGREERRLQLRAYNLWTKLLRGRELPGYADLGPQAAAQFAGHGILLDVSEALGDPAIVAVGVQLAELCGAQVAATRGSELPAGTLLACLAERHGQVLASRAPVSFDAHVADPCGRTLLCRGILLPFAGEDADDGGRWPVARIWGAVNWKEVLGADETDALLRELGTAMEQLAPGQEAAALPGHLDDPKRLSSTAPRV